VRLAKALGLHGCACGADACRQAIEEAVARALERESMARHKTPTPREEQGVESRVDSSPLISGGRGAVPGGPRGEDDPSTTRGGGQAPRGRG
jgi:hypothetical protein